MSIMAESGYIGFFDRLQLRAEAKGKAKSVLKVLAARGLDIPDDVRDRVLACTDTDQLDQLLKRAITVTTAKDLLD